MAGSKLAITLCILKELIPQEKELELQGEFWAEFGGMGGEGQGEKLVLRQLHTPPPTTTPYLWLSILGPLMATGPTWNLRGCSCISLAIPRP